MQPPAGGAPLAKGVFGLKFMQRRHPKPQEPPAASSSQAAAAGGKSSEEEWTFEAGGAVASPAAGGALREEDALATAEDDGALLRFVQFTLHPFQIVRSLVFTGLEGRGAPGLLVFYGLFRGPFELLESLRSLLARIRSVGVASRT